MSAHTKPTNAEIARLRELGRRRRSRSEAGRFLVEGPKLVEEALQSGLNVIDIVARDDWYPSDDTERLADDRGVHIRWAAANVIEKIATTTSPQPVVAEVELPSAGWDVLDMSNNATTSALAVMVCVDLNDPGNLGTTARSAVAAGFDAVIALGDCADPFGPKTVRSSAGALFRVPVVVDRSVTGGLQQISDAGLRRIGTRMVDAAACDQSRFDTSLAIVLGNEAHGLRADVASMIDEWVSVPMAGQVESLNVAMAATILSYEVARQRRDASGQ